MGILCCFNNQEHNRLALTLVGVNQRRKRNFLCQLNVTNKEVWKVYMFSITIEPFYHVYFTQNKVLVQSNFLARWKLDEENQVRYKY